MKIKRKNKHYKAHCQKAIRELRGFMVDSNFPQMLHQSQIRSKSLTHFRQPNYKFKEISINPFLMYSVHSLSPNPIYEVNDFSLKIRR
jgi:hypothetical protein